MPDRRLSLASNIAVLLDSGRLRQARELRGLTQSGLLELAGRPITTPALSQIERGVTRPSPETLIALSDALQMPIEYFASRVGRSGNTNPPGYFRSLRSTSARDRKRALGYVSLLHDLVAAIEANLRLPQVSLPSVPTRPNATRNEVEQIATDVRSHFGLQCGPVDHVVHSLERHGVVVIRLTTDLNRVDAFSVSYKDRPLVVLTADKGNGARSRFDAAHELGHLVMHHDVSEWEREAEQQAHWFAAALLMPAQDIKEELPSATDWRALMNLKARWKVSVAALLKRAQTLEVMSNHSYTNAMKAMSARGWRKSEPGDNALGPPEAPMLLEAATSRLAEMGIDLPSLAEQAALPLADVKQLISQTADTRPRLDL